MGNVGVRHSSFLGFCASNHPHLDAMRVVNQPVEDAVGRGRTPDLFVPARTRLVRVCGRVNARQLADSCERGFAVGPEPEFHRRCPRAEGLSRWRSGFVIGDVDSGATTGSSRRLARSATAGKDRYSWAGEGLVIVSIVVLLLEHVRHFGGIHRVHQLLDLIVAHIDAM